MSLGTTELIMMGTIGGFVLLVLAAFWVLARRR